MAESQREAALKFDEGLSLPGMGPESNTRSENKSSLVSEDSGLFGAFGQQTGVVTIEGRNNLRLLAESGVHYPGAERYDQSNRGQVGDSSGAYCGFQRLIQGHNEALLIQRHSAHNDNQLHMIIPTTTQNPIAIPR